MHSRLVIQIILATSLLASCGKTAARPVLTDESVRAYYAAQIDATRRYDAKALCDGMAADYRQTDHSDMRGLPPVTEQYDRAKACRSAEQSVGLYRQLEARGGKIMFNQNITSIAHALDRLSAEVRLISSATIDGKLLMDSVSTERIVLRNGKILSLGGEARSKVDAAVLEDLANRVK